MNLNMNKKTERKDRNSNDILWSKVLRAMVKAYQRDNNGKDPRSVIPRNTDYCYRIKNVSIPEDGSPPIIHCKVCPHWYAVVIPESERADHPCIVTDGQDHVGGCKFLQEVDGDDGSSFGLLWDQVKNCGIYQRF